MQAIDEIILGNSLAVKEMKKLIEMVSKSNTTVLIQGETGTGKELVAEALHVASARKGNNISVNCAAIPSELLESELFGHEKGACTGSDRASPGRFEQADNGTIFLDEIGDMPLPLQSKLLRVLESRKIQRVGSNKETEVKFRLVCATHQDLDKKVENPSEHIQDETVSSKKEIKLPSFEQKIVDEYKRIKNEDGEYSAQLYLNSKSFYLPKGFDPNKF